MQPLYLKSEDALYAYLKKFLVEKPNAAQLDGSTVEKHNSKVILVFQYSVDGEQYKLLGELTRKAAEEFVHLVEEHGDAGAVLKENTESKKGGLTLASANPTKGWACLPYVHKTSAKLKKAG